MLIYVIIEIDLDFIDKILLDVETTYNDLICYKDLFFDSHYQSY